MSLNTLAYRHAIDVHLANIAVQSIALTLNIATVNWPWIAYNACFLAYSITLGTIACASHEREAKELT